MLTSTFLHAPGVGEQTERKLWDAGLLTWDDITRAALSDLPVGKSTGEALRATVAQSQTALAEGNFRYFAEALPAREHWRAAPQFMDKVGFLDIETNGGFRADDITIIGVYDGDESRIFVKYKDLDDFRAEAERCALWVTFFGTGFDVPFLRRKYPDLPFDQLHIDLCPALKRLGFKGGLKKIEERIGIRRTPEVEGMSGYDAVRLWRAWRRHKDAEALNLLIAYNRADIENLSLLLAFAYGRLKAASGYPG